MKYYDLTQWMAHPILSAPSGGDRITLGNKYICLPGAFAEGTFGDVMAGWGRDGAAVAVKRLKRPARDSFDAHRELMAYIGIHVSHS